MAQIQSSHVIRQVLANNLVRHFAGPTAGNWAGSKPAGWVHPGYGHSSIYFAVAQGASLATDESGSVWVGQSQMARLDGVANSPYAVTAFGSGAGALDVTPDGQVVWVDTADNQVKTVIDEREVVLAGTGTTLGDEWGSGTAAANAKFASDPADLVIGPDGSIYIAYKKVVRRIYIDGPGRLTGQQDIEIPAADGSEIHVFDSTGRHLRTRDPVTNIDLWTFAYDPDGLLESMTDRNGRTTTIQRVAGVAQSITSPDGIVTQLVVEDNHLRSVTDAAGSSWALSYGEQDNMLETMIDPRGYLHRYTFDESGRLILDEDAGNGSKALTRVELDEGYEVEVETALGRVNAYRVEPAEGAIREQRTRTFPDGTQTHKVSYNNGTSMVTHADGTVVTKWTEPDPILGSLATVTSHVSVAYPLGGLTQHVYGQRFESGDEWVEQVSDSASFTEPLEVRYDRVTREGILTSPEGRQVTFVLDSVGRLLEYAAPGVAPVYYQYDPQGRVTQIQQGAGAELRRVSFERDDDGFVDLLTAFLGVIERDFSFTRDGVGRVLSVLLPDAESLGLEWDPEGRLRKVTVPTDLAQPEPHEMTYDPVGMMTKYDPPDVSGGPVVDETVYVYDDDHRPTQVTLANGESLSVAYNPTTHRVDEVVTSDGAALVPTYDSAGRVTHLEGPYWSGNPAAANVSLAYTYNGPLVTSEQWIGDTSGTVSWAYNNRGLVSSQQVDGSWTAGYTYDEDGLLLTAGSATLGRSVTSGRVESVTLSTVEQTLSYDSFGDVAGSVYAETTGPTDLYEYALVRDQLGRITQETKIVDGGTPEVWSYEYDARGRLERVELDGVLYAEYGYDPNGNRTSVTTAGGTTSATYDEQDRIIASGAVVYTHSATGEIVGKSDGTQYEYDALGNLVAVTLPDQTEIAYEYDGRGRPVARYVDGVYDKGWLWGSQLDPVAEVDAQGTVIARYVYGSRRQVPDYAVIGGVSYRLITDYRGSVVRVVDAGDGTVAQELEYGPWGEVLSDSAPGFQGFGYAGGIWDGDTGLVLFGARWYDAGTGRWMSRDPALFGGQQANLYLYAHGDPLNFIDASGRVPVPVILAGAGAAVGAAVWAWRRWGRGERYVEVEEYYASKGRGFDDIEVFRGGFMDFFGKERSAVTLGNTVYFGSSCEPFADTSEYYLSHPEGATVAEHELAHVLDFRDNWLGYFLRGATTAIVIEPIGTRWFWDGEPGRSSFEYQTTAKALRWPIQ